MKRISLLFSTAFWICALAAHPSTLRTGPLTLVHPNDLNTNTTAESFLLLHFRQTIDEAEKTCSSLNESLATVDALSSAVRQHLAVLAFDGQLQPNDSLLLNAHDSLYLPTLSRRGGTACSAYSIVRDAVEDVPCGSLLKALCTQSAPPTSLANRKNVSQGAEIVMPVGLAQYVGYRDARSFRFLGIPYAEPPVGRLRFSPTRPTALRGVINATRFGNVCLQNSEDDFAAKGEAQSEDCLFLNVFTPSLPVLPSLAKLKPVGFWIHGGAFTMGSGSRAIYDGGNLASRGDVIIVTINYRLNILGLLLVADGDGLGNAWLSDVLLALKWVQDNISAFGGDPDKVPIFGESSGALSVAALLSSPAASGLFHAAISESSLHASPWLTPHVYTEIVTPAIVAAFRTDNITDVVDPMAFLRSISSERFSSGTALAAANSEPDAFRAAMFHTTSVDITALLPTVGGLIQDQLVYLLGNRTLPNKVPLLIGTNRDEVALVVYTLVGLRLEAPVPPNVQLYDTLLAGALGQDAAAAVLADGVYVLNTSDPDGVRRDLTTALTARGFKCSMRDLLLSGLGAHAFEAGQLSVYRFDTGYPLVPNARADACFPESDGPSHPACHGSDMVPVFGTFNVLGVPLNSIAELHFTQYASDIWASFIRTHSPDISQEYLAPFKALDPVTTDGTHVFADEPFNEGPFDRKECAVFDGFGYAYDFLDNSF